MTTKTPEARFSALVVKSLKGCYITRIESRVGLGTPDMLIGLANGRFVMVELKAVTRGLQVKLSPHQIAFHLKHAAVGCPVFVLVQYKRDGERHGLIKLYLGADADKLVADGLRIKPIKEWETNKMDWEELGKTLEYWS